MKAYTESEYNKIVEAGFDPDDIVIRKLWSQYETPIDSFINYLGHVEAEGLALWNMQRESNTCKEGDK